jgi:hypothetical protein
MSLATPQNDILVFGQMKRIRPLSPVAGTDVIRGANRAMVDGRFDEDRLFFHFRAKSPMQESAFFQTLANAERRGYIKRRQVQ